MPYIWKVILTYVPIKGVIIYPYVYKFLNCSAKHCPSLPTMLTLFNVIEWPVVDWWPYMGEVAIKCSLNLWPNVVADSPVYSLLHSCLLHLYQCIILLLFIWSVSFGVTWMFLSVLLSLKYVPYLLQMFLTLSHRLWTYGKTMYPLDLFDGSVLLLLILVIILKVLLLLGLFCWEFLCGSMDRRDCTNYRNGKN